MKVNIHCITSVVILLLSGCSTLSAPQAPTDVSQYFDHIKSSPPQLRAFLQAMPKGGDLHSHTSGAVYAEKFIQSAVKHNLCINTATWSITAPPCASRKGIPTVANYVASNTNYNRLIDALSTRNYDLGGRSGRDQFFGTFSRFSLASGAEPVANYTNIIKNAASQNIQYLELMSSPGMTAVRKLGKTVGYNADYDIMVKQLEGAGIQTIVDQAQSYLTEANAAIRKDLKCSTPSAAPACSVDVRHLSQIIRTFSKEEVFAQIMLAFLVTEQVPSVVGINIVAPEDDPISLADYSEHMKMIGYFSQKYKDVKIALHAGELTLGLVPPEHLRHHITEAVNVAHANRIGHGVDIMYEDKPIDLLRQMAKRKIAVEINLSSNDVILGVSGAEHPFETYRAFNVPVVLATDDEGVLRTDLTNEYKRAVQTYDLSYADVKALSFNSVVYSFADAATRYTLLSNLKAAFAAFETSYPGLHLK